MKEKTKIIKNWKELIDFIEKLNNYKETIVLSGWINEFEDGRTRINRLYFTVRDVYEINKTVKKNERTKLDKKSMD